MDTEIKILLGQKHINRYPTVLVKVNDQEKDLTISNDTWVCFNLNFSKDEKIILTIEHYGKTKLDCSQIEGQDTAVIIKDICLNGISDQKFIWQSTFYPNYPDDYEPKIFELKGSTYLGFNGVWKLEMTAPIFTWIHKTLDLGWIYD